MKRSPWSSRAATRFTGSRTPRGSTRLLCSAAPPVSDEVAAELELLPPQPPALDVVPWLQRRLLQLVEEATHIRAAALASLPA